ncbi:MAG: phage tail protein, partial [Clostridia bacterium]|nr:phage tail protein [Clostridia bacterium]
GKMYLDLLSSEVDVSKVSGQKIQIGRNLIDIKREAEGSEVFSGIIPLGAKIGDSEKRIDVSSVNGGSYFITDNTAVSAYGKIYKPVIFENVTDSASLLSEARTYLAENFAAVNSIEITAFDLSETSTELDSFNVGEWVTVLSGKHFKESQTFLVRKMSINILNPAETKIEVGKKQQGLTDSLGNVTHDLSNIISSINSVAGNIGGISAKADTATTLANDASTKATSAASTASAANTTANNALTKANSATTTISSVSSRVTTIEERPYISERGNTGIWTWKKFSDGTCEFFAKIAVSGYSVTTTLGGWFSGANLYGLYDVIYPFTLKEVPSVAMTFQSTNNTSAVPWVFSNNATTALSYLPQCYLIRPTSVTNVYGYLNIIVKGKY